MALSRHAPTRRHRHLVLLTTLVSALPLLSHTQPAPGPAKAEVAALRRRVPTFRTVRLPATSLTLTKNQSLTVDQLRGVILDDAPPELAPLAKPYKANMTDTFAPGTATYVAKDIRPFRLKYFNCEFNYGGWHNYAMADYAATRGFNIIYPYVRTTDEGTHLPTGTKWLTWGGFINWHKWLPKHNLQDGRYDLLAEMDLVSMHTEAGIFRRAKPPAKLKEAADLLMIDMEHPLLPRNKLRKQPWYPAQGTEAERTAFEKRYFDGYARTYTSAVEAARKEGWGPISIYGWQPYGRTWGGLEKPEVEPGTDVAWNAFGRQIYDTVDIVHSSVYCFYWSPQNVAYTLANIDSNMEIINSMPVKRPLRPYYWTLLHGGGGGWRWWRGQPLADEEKRAMIAMAFFTGIDGFDTWNWSGTGSHHVPPALLSGKKKDKDYFSSGADVMLAKGFRLAAEGTAEETEKDTFKRYDVLHVLELDEAAETVRFQKIRHRAKNHGVAEEFPTYQMPASELRPLLRIKSEPVAAMIEGMALIKPFEYILRHGDVQIDVPARRQFKENLPIVRRVTSGNLHVMITYDPGVVYGNSPRDIVLNDFAGRTGRTLTLPADQQPRIFVLEEGEF